MVECGVAIIISIAMKKLFFCYAVVLLCGSTHSAHAQNLLQNGDFSQGKTAWTIPANERISSSLVEARAGNNTKALQLVLSPVAGENPWNIIVRQSVNAPLKKGDALSFKAWLRSPQSLKTFAFLEAKDEKFTKSLQKELTLSPDWKEYQVSGIAQGNYAAGETTLGFHLGFGAGTIEMTGLQLQSSAATAPLTAVENIAPLPAPVAPIPVAPAPNGTASLQNPQTLVPNGDFSTQLEGNWRAAGTVAPTLEVVDAKIGGFSRALRLQIATKPGMNAWESRLTTERTASAIEKGARLGVRFWARSPQKLQIAAIYQLADAPNTKTIFRNLTLSPEWKEYRVLGRAADGFEPNASNFEFHLGYGAGSVEIAGVRVEDFGAGEIAPLELKLGAKLIDYWGAATPDDAWKKAAFERIEKHRKSDLKIRVVDAQGKPVRGATVKLAQTRQQFRFGSAVVAGRLIDTQNPDNLRYQSEVKRLFNTIVFENDLKWDNRNTKAGEQALEAAKWLRQNGIEIRGHTLVWGARKWMPPVVAENWEDTEKVRALVRARVREAAQAWKGQLYVWDVVNEAAVNTELWEKLGWDEFANVFKIAREVDPNVKLAYNDYNISNESQNPVTFGKQRIRVAQLIEMLREKGAPVEIYGDQAHFGTPLTTPARVVQIWDEVAKIGLPIEVTEYDAGISDDRLHGEFTRDLLIAAFAEPKMQSFIMWGFWEGSHWRAGEGGAMFRRDWSKRPAQEAYEKLVLNDWMTNQTLQTGADGAVSTRGFLGDYDVTISAAGKSKVIKMKLPKDGARLQIAL